MNTVMLLPACASRMLRDTVPRVYRCVLSMATIFYILPRVGRGGVKKALTSLFPNT